MTQDERKALEIIRDAFADASAALEKATTQLTAILRDDEIVFAPGTRFLDNKGTVWTVDVLGRVCDDHGGFWENVYDFRDMSGRRVAAILNPT